MNEANLLCPKCQQPVPVILPDYFCINHPLFTSVTIPHEQGVVCPNCLQYSFIAAGELAISYGLTPGEPPKKVIQAPVVPPGLKLVEH